MYDILGKLKSFSLVEISFACPAYLMNGLNSHIIFLIRQCIQWLPPFAWLGSSKIQVLSPNISIAFITGSCNSTNPSPRSASKKLASTLRSLSFKRREEIQDGELLQQPQDDPCQDLETAYVAQICLTWEALHCQYTQLSQKISSQPENSTCYSHVAQRFQQFQVLLQRFIENEPFEQGHRAEIYARNRCSLPMFLQVPSIQGKCCVAM